MKTRLALIAALAALPAVSFAAGDCGGAPAQFVLRSDNDVYGRANQDQGYTAGANIGWVSPSFAGGEGAGCLPRGLRWADDGLAWLARGADRRNLVLNFHLGVFTPTDGTRGDLIVDDRPYAGLMTLSLGHNARRGERLDSSHLRLGMVGPSAQGEWAQDSVHQFFGRPRFRGWDNQLRDEVVVQLQHERLWRLHRVERASGWGWDLTAHAGGALGNLASFANGGAELRFGLHLPDDFGTDPFRPAGENSAPRTDTGRPGGWAWNVFLGLDARWLAQDITLDGNTWKDGHSVERHAGVADLSLGLAVSHGPWKLAYAHVRRSREFAGQEVRPVFGSLTVSRDF